MGEWYDGLGYVYELRHTATVATAITVLQVKAGTTRPVVIVKARVSQRGTTASLQEAIGFVRKSSAATVTTAVVDTHLFKTRLADPTTDLSLGASATGVIATAEGTDSPTTPVIKDGFNVVGRGWSWTGKLFVPISGIVGLKFLDAPTTQTWLFSLTLVELGG